MKRGKISRRLKTATACFGVIVAGVSVFVLVRRTNLSRDSETAMRRPVEGQQALVNWPPWFLHYDASADTLSELTVGDVPLS
jgi:hypothetical protein